MRPPQSSFFGGYNVTTFDKRQEIAVQRLQLITPLVNQSLDEVDQLKRRREIAEESGLSEKTICRYVSQFKTKGIEGLVPLRDGRPGSRSIPHEILQEAILLKRQNLKRSLREIIRCLEIEGKIKTGSVKRSTLQYQMSNCGFSSAQMKLYSDSNSAGGQRFQRNDKNALWQSDGKHGPHINKKKTYLISFIDDATRLVLHSEFYYHESIDSVFDCFRKAIIKYGIPKAIYVDNGSPFRSNALGHTCGKLTITRLRTKPYTPQSKGKIEKFHQVVDRFLTEMTLDKANDLKEFNFKWECFLSAYYQTKEHDALPPDTSPESAFNKDETKLRIISQEELDSAFLQVVHGRKVDKSGCINFKGDKYTADGLSLHIGRKVDVVWKASAPTEVWIEIANFPKMKAKKLVIREWVPKSTKLIPNPFKLKADSSRLVDAAETEFKRKEAERLNALFGQDHRSSANDDSLFSPGGQISEDFQNRQLKNTDPMEADNGNTMQNSVKPQIFSFSELNSSTDEGARHSPKRPVISFTSLTKNKGEQ
jgi:transposase InsO family protein